MMIFNPLALALFAFQFQNVPIYRQFCERRRIGPNSVTRWEQIPALPVVAFKEHIVSSIAKNERRRVFHSSGTTAQVPSRHFHHAASLALYESSLLSWFERHFPSDGSMLVFLTPPPAQAPHSSLVHMFETINQKFDPGESWFMGAVQPDGSWGLDFERMEPLFALFKSSRRKVSLFGTAFSFVHWLDHCESKNLRHRLPAGSRIMETGGYKGRSRTVEKAELRRLMTKYLTVPDSQIVTEYGMSELSSQAYDRVAGQVGTRDRVYHFPPWARTQIISPETGRAAAGEAGLLRIVDLANVHSVMALQTGDMAVQRGDGFELLGRAEATEARGCSLMAAT